MLFRLFSIIITLLLLITSTAYSEEIKQLPIGKTAVIDTADILSLPEKQQLENRLHQINASGQITPALVIIKTTDGTSIFDYSMEVFRQWQLGDAKTNNGLLMLIAIEDRKYQIITGYGLEGELSDTFLSQIQRQHLPQNFRENRYVQGINEVFDEITTRMALPVNQRIELFNNEQKVAKTDKITNTYLSIALLLSIITGFLYRKRIYKRIYILLFGIIVNSIFISIIYSSSGGINELSSDLLGANTIFFILHYMIVLFLSPFIQPKENITTYSGSGNYNSSSNYDYDSSSNYDYSSSSSSYSSSSGSYGRGGGSSGGGGAGGSW